MQGVKSWTKKREKIWITRKPAITDMLKNGSLVNESELHLFCLDDASESTLSVKVWDQINKVPKADWRSIIEWMSWIKRRVESEESAVFGCGSRRSWDDGVLGELAAGGARQQIQRSGSGRQTETRVQLEPQLECVTWDEWVAKSGVTVRENSLALTGGNTGVLIQMQMQMSWQRSGDERIQEDK